MDERTLCLLSSINSEIIKFRGIYSEWSNLHGIGYNEMLVLYTIRERGYCNQKHICDNYKIPRQTMNNVISRMRQDSILKESEEYTVGKEKAFVLTQKGEASMQPIMDSLDQVENRAVELLGTTRMIQLTELMHEYNQVLIQALEETR